MSVPDTTPAGAIRSVWTWAALLVAAAGTAGSLYVSLSPSMQLVACPLCFYQRTFMMSVVAVLAVGLATGQSRRLTLLALPLAVGGLGVAILHVSLEVRDILECPTGIFGLGSVPQQSLAAFAIIFVLLIIDAWQGASAGQLPWAGWPAAIAVGVLLAVASTIANPPLPAAPKQPYPDAAPKICRPPYHASS
jgi:disulfide bond formation protein DsbB